LSEKKKTKENLQIQSTVTKEKGRQQSVNDDDDNRKRETKSIIEWRTMPMLIGVFFTGASSCALSGLHVWASRLDAIFSTSSVYRCF